MNPIEQRLREKIGLDSATIGSSAIERAVRLRMKSLGLKTPEDYQRRLETSRDEWEELVEAVVVTETWFFRDRAPASVAALRRVDPFTALVQLVRLEWLPRFSTAPVRLLSVPCASGEEPYSLAMALLDAGIPPTRFTIDAVDLSARALARAQSAVYGKNSFRGKNLDFRERYFQATPDGHALQAGVRTSVQFHRANIFEENFLAGRATYDFIFCRNLLIYFAGAARVKALEKLDRLLAPEGVLFVGPAELPLATAHGFISANIPMAFACRKKATAAKPGTIRPAATGREHGGRGRIAEGPKTAAPPQRKHEDGGWKMENSDGPLPHSGMPSSILHSPSSAPEPSPLADLAAARQLADAGRLAEATMICQAHLDRQGPSAQAYYLLGLVRDAAGDPQAVDDYRKALYLEPNHYETLLQMSLLLEKNGDWAGARTFKRRAERVQQQP